MNYERKGLNKALMIIIVVVIVVVSSIVLITNAIISHWGIIEIMVGIGTTLAIIGAIGVYTSFAGGTRVSSTTMHAMSPEMAHAERKYAFKRRQALPVLSFIIFFAGVILLIIFMPKIWV
ncbi:MAG: hypothetical protein ACTSQX_15695 [Candidatus Heimdallarchaeota archaeon]